MRNSLQEIEDITTGMKAAGSTVRVAGRIREVTTSSFSVAGLADLVKLGDHLEIIDRERTYLAEAVRIGRDHVIAKPFEATVQMGIGAEAWHKGAFRIFPDSSWRGRTIDALARPIDGGPPLVQGDTPMNADRDPPNPMRRARIERRLRTGVRVVDLFTPLCAGQRIGIFAGSGVGKSTLLSMLARPADNETVVIGLIGERGREVREFIDQLEANTRARTITIASTGDQSASMRRLGAQTAMTVAEYFRDKGENVLLIVDSITRYAHAAREVSIAAGEIPVARGYTPSVFSDLPRLLERAGPGEQAGGTITGIFSVLVDGDDHNDPVADSIRGTLDGHIVLERSIAEQGRYPAVNPTTSISRLATVAWTPEQSELILKLRSLISLYEETRDLRMIGGYREGADAALDNAILLAPKIYGALCQSPEEPESRDAFAELSRALQQIKPAT